MNTLNRKSESAEVLDFELNLAPIIDCFTVLITFMLVSASFLSVGILDASLNAAAEKTSTSPPPIVIQVDLGTDYTLTLKVTGKATSNTTIPSSVEKQWNFDKLNQDLAQLKQTWPQTESLIINAAEDLEYKNLVLAMEQIRKVIPGILLGGF